MIEVRQIPGNRKWKGDDWLAMRNAYLRLIEGFFYQFGDFVIFGRKKSGTTINPGVVMAGGKARLFAGATGVSAAYYVKPTSLQENTEYETIGTGIGYETFSVIPAASSEAGAIRLDTLPRFADAFKPATAGGATTATRLASARTLWGRSFDGSANVSGDMSGVGNLAMTGALSRATDGAFSGDLTAIGFYQSSDRRLKNVLKPFEPTPEDIPALPLIYHGAGRSPRKGGNRYDGAALPEKFPKPVKKDKKGYYTVCYDKLSILALRGIAPLSREPDRISQRLDRIEKTLSDGG